MTRRLVLPILLVLLLLLESAAWGARRTHPFPDEPLYLACPPVSLAPAALPPALQEAPYAWKVPAFGGKEPVRLMVTGGSLPPGLILSSDGTLSGTPKAAGSFTFSVNSTDSCKSSQQSVSRSYRLVIVDSAEALAAVVPSILLKGPLSITAVPTPATVTVTSGRGDAVTIRYRITAKPEESATLTSPGATFRAGGTVIGSVPAPLTVSLVNGTADIDEIVTISGDILQRARRENVGKMLYSRPFIGRGTTALAVIEVVLPVAVR
jgi:hypothetical protein